jgi:hypothetical protein
MLRSRFVPLEDRATLAPARAYERPQFGMQQTLKDCWVVWLDEMGVLDEGVRPVSDPIKPYRADGLRSYVIRHFPIARGD